MALEGIPARNRLLPTLTARAALGIYKSIPPKKELKTALLIGEDLEQQLLRDCGYKSTPQPPGALAVGGEGDVPARCFPGASQTSHSYQ